MIEIPVSEKTALPPWPRANVEEFVFSVRSWGGTRSGNGVFEFDWTLEVDSRRGLVTLESFRSDGDVPGEPVGVFRMRMSDGELGEFRYLVGVSGLDRLRPAMKVHPAYTARDYRFRVAGRPAVEVHIDNADSESNAAIVPLRRRIVALLVAVMEHPERSIRLGLAFGRGPAGDIFTITVTNHGLERVCFTDPRWIVEDGRMRRAVVMMSELAEEVPGGPPPFLAWEDLPLAPLPAPLLEEPMITMAPGSNWKIMAPVVGRDPRKRYVAYFTWANYAGSAMVGGAYRIRGRMASPRVVLAPSAAR